MKNAITYAIWEFKKRKRRKVSNKNKRWRIQLKQGLKLRERERESTPIKLNFKRENTTARDGDSMLFEDYY